jgi:flavin reductase (DIM6/NTAB) family NADH-FMN oxidoreductase RutF
MTESHLSVPLHTGDVLSLLPPYPIVLVTVGDNIITVNQVEYFTFSPLRVGVAIAHARHTHSLLTAAGAFVVNVPAAELVDAVKVCGAVSGRDCDKFLASGLTRLTLAGGDFVGIAECGAQIACRVDREIEFEHRTWFVGQVVGAWRRGEHTGAVALTCGRDAYRLPGDIVASR